MNENAKRVILSRAVAALLAASLVPSVSAAQLALPLRRDGHFCVRPLHVPSPPMRFLSPVLYSIPRARVNFFALLP